MTLYGLEKGEDKKAPLVYVVFMCAIVEMTKGIK